MAILSDNVDVITPLASDDDALEFAAPVDAETVLRADLSEPVYGECPWEATYELRLKKPDGARVLWIRLDREDKELRGELDPWKFRES